jgi:hypothetical protein
MSNNQNIQDELENKLGYNPETHRAYTVDDYFKDMNDIMAGRKLVTDIGVPKPRFDVSALRLFILFPIFMLAVFVKDPFCDWKRWRVIGALGSLLLTLLVFVAYVVVGVFFDLSDDSAPMNMMLNFATAGAFGIIIFVWPRTSFLLLLLAVIISILSFLIHLI